jgi:NTE family protein
MIASGLTAADLEREWRQLTTDQIHRVRLNPLDYLERPSLLDTTPWEATLERQISFHRVRTSPIIFRAISTDIQHGQARVFRNEEMTVRHILASCSIPVVYPWTHIDAEIYWDGAVMANTPLRPALDEGAEEIYVVLLSPVGARTMPVPTSLADVAAYVLDLALLASFETDQKQIEKVNRRVLEGRDASGHHIVKLHVIAPSESIPAAWILSYNEKQAEHLIQLGYADATRTLAVS